MTTGWPYAWRSTLSPSIARIRLQIVCVWSCQATLSDQRTVGTGTLTVGECATMTSPTVSLFHRGLIRCSTARGMSHGRQRSELMLGYRVGVRVGDCLAPP